MGDVVRHQYTLVHQRSRRNEEIGIFDQRARPPQFRVDFSSTAAHISIHSQNIVQLSEILKRLQLLCRTRKIS